MKKKTKKPATATVLKREVLERLVELKLTIDSLKPVYGEYDNLLELILANGPTLPEVSFSGAKWRLLLVDLFADRNTAWKSVAQRRFDLEISRVDTSTARSKEFFKVRRSR